MKKLLATTLAALTLTSAVASQAGALKPRPGDAVVGGKGCLDGSIWRKDGDTWPVTINGHKFTFKCDNGTIVFLLFANP